MFQLNNADLAVYRKAFSKFKHKHDQNRHVGTSAIIFFFEHHKLLVGKMWFFVEF